MPRKPSTEKCKTMLQKKISKNISEGAYKSPKQAVAVAYSQLADKCDFPKKASMKKTKGGFGGFADFGIMSTKADTPAQARQRKKDIAQAEQRKAEQEAMYKDAITYEEGMTLLQAKDSLTEEEKQMLEQFSPAEQTEILRERSKVMGGRICRGGSASSEAPSASNRTIVQSIGNAHARVNDLRAQLELEALPVPDTRAEPEENSTSYQMRLREMLSDFLDQERGLQRALAQRRAREAQSAQGQSEGSRQPRRRLFE